MARITWKNWAGNQESSARVVDPGDLRSLKEIVRSTVCEGHRIRAAGAGYSWSRLVPVRQEDTIIQMHRLNRVVAIDKQKRTITVESGMTVDELTRIAARNGLTLSTPPLFPKVTIGGAIATGAHGTDVSRGNFSDQIRAMTIVARDGSERTVQKGDVDFHAAQVALGTLGIVYSVELRVESDYSVYVDERRVPVRYVLEELDDLVRSYDFVEIFWYPLQDYMWLYLMYRTRSRTDSPSAIERAIAGFRDGFELVTGHVVLPYIARFSPRLTPALSWAASSLGQEVHQSILPASQAFHFQRTYLKSWDVSYAVPTSEAARAWGDAIHMVEEYARAGLYPVNLAVHCRFTGSSHAWLAPNYGRDTCYIEAVTALDTRHWRRFFVELEDRWLSIEGARPHWGKLYSRPQEIAVRYPRMRDFLEVRETWDPDRVFLNSFLENAVFQLPSRSMRSLAAGTGST